MTEGGIAGANGATAAPSTVRELDLPEAAELAKLAAVFEDLQYWSIRALLYSRRIS